jgi:hypothetical protein
MCAIDLLFVFCKSYVQLLTLQHWSFVLLVLTLAESSTWYGPVSGLTLLTLALGAAGVGTLSGRMGLLGVLVVYNLALVASMCFGCLAHGIPKEVSFALFILLSLWPE